MTIIDEKYLCDPILVSACLVGEECRYDGGSAPCAAVQELGKTHTLLSICPEQLGGMPTPRKPAEMKEDGRIYDCDGLDRTAAFAQGAIESVWKAHKNGCMTAILKSGSPSCGCYQIPDGTFSGTYVPGRGVAAETLEHAGIRIFDEHDLEETLG